MEYFLMFPPYSLRYVSTLFYHPRLGLVSVLFSSVFFPISSPYAFLAIHSTCPSIFNILGLHNQIIFVEEYVSLMSTS